MGREGRGAPKSSKVKRAYSKDTYLIVLVEPEKCQVGNSDGLPVVLDLLSGAVDNMRHFICDDEFQVLLQSI